MISTRRSDAAALRRSRSSPVCARNSARTTSRLCQFFAARGRTDDARLQGDSSKEDMGIKIAGLPRCQVHFAKCCTPLPGDEIIGYITRGRGVTIHSKECVNVNASHDPARWVEAEWSDTVNSSYNGSIQILAQDRATCWPT